MWPGQFEQALDLAGDEVVVTAALQAGEVQPEQRPGGDLGVEGLGGCDRHLDVAAAARVDHAVDLEGQVRVAAVDDGQRAGAPLAHHVDGAVGVGGGPRLADGDDERVGHGGGVGLLLQDEAAELRGLERLDVDRRVLQVVGQEVGAGERGDTRRALADEVDAADRSVV